MAGVQILVPGDGITLGSTTAQTFHPDEILYYILHIDTNNLPPSNENWSFTFSNVNGLYDGNDIDTLVGVILDGSVTDLELLSLYDDPIEPPSITVENQCYVVIQLTSNDPTVKFQAGVPAIKTQLNKRTKYCRLTHVDASGDTHRGAAQSACNLIYFAVQSVNPTADEVNDLFNIYLQYTPPAGTTQFYVKDPAVKNRGGGTF